MCSSDLCWMLPTRPGWILLMRKNSNAPNKRWGPFRSLGLVVIGFRMCSCCRGERPDPAETLIAARRLAGARPHLAAVAGIVHREDLWRLCRVELTGVDVRADC